MKRTLVRVNWKGRKLPVVLTLTQRQYLTMGLRNLTATRRAETQAMSQRHTSHPRTPLKLKRDLWVAHLWVATSEEGTLAVKGLNIEAPTHTVSVL
jgi:hypothetical protein